MKIAELLSQATGALRETSATPRLDAELLLAHTLGWSRARLLAERDYRPTPAETARFHELVGRRAKLEPVAYLVGRKAFFGLDLYVDRRVLVPRPETELLVELALAEAGRILAEQPPTPRLAPPPLVIADIGTGSGAIAVALAANLPAARVYATDISPAALEVAERNVAGHGLSERVRLLHGDLLDPLPEPVDLLVSNPPYTVLAEIDMNVRAHEPWLALDGGDPDGMAVYRRLLAGVAGYLRPGGAVLLEIGAWQAERVSELLATALPGARISVHQDMAGRDRVVVAGKESGASRRPGGSSS